MPCSIGIAREVQQLALLRCHRTLEGVRTQVEHVDSYRYEDVGKTGLFQSVIKGLGREPSLVRKVILTRLLYLLGVAVEHVPDCDRTYRRFVQHVLDVE